PIERGEQSFMAYCASCHGSDGTGTGPVAEVMTTVPADLTQLRARYGGTFPADSVYAYIDGRQDVQAHGTREMPVWGNVWSEADGEPVDREEVDLRIRELVEYIRTLQEDPDAS
ncbi:MAG: cytochrome c, partial [Rhodothermales bacterium]